MRHSALLSACVSFLILAACQTVSQPPLSPTLGQVTNPVANHIQAATQPEIITLPKLQTQAQINVVQARPGYSKLSFNIGFRELNQGFKTQAVECGNVAYARVQVSGVGMSSPLYAVGASNDQYRVIPVTNNTCQVSATIDAVPYGPARVFDVSLFDSNFLPISGGNASGVSHIDATTGNIQISFRETVTARIMANLIAQGASGELLASQVNLTQLQNLINDLTQPQGAFPYTFTTDPSLLNLSALTSALQAANGDVSQLSNTNPAFINSPQTLAVNLNGYINGQAITVSLDDPISTGLNVNANGNVNLSNVPPGTWNLTVSGAGYITQHLSVTVNPDGSNNLNPVTILPPAPTFTAFDEGSDNFTFAGGQLIITGTGFNATQIANNKVFFGSTEATVTAATATSLTVTVPSGLSGDQSVSLKIGERTTTLSTITLDTPFLGNLAVSSAKVGDMVDLFVSPISSTVSENLVSFGSFNAITVTAISGGLRATVPAGAWGEVQLGVKTLGSISSNLQTFKIVPDISTSTVPVVNGGALVIKGTGFAPTSANNTVTINGAAVAVDSVDANGIHVTLPTGLFGSVLVKVTTSGGESAAYNLPIKPLINALATSSGSSGTVLNVTGTGFHTTAASNTVELGSTVLTKTVSSTTEMNITLPNLTAGVYPLKVTVGTQASAETRNITLLPHVSAIESSQTVSSKPALLGGETITLTGTNFDLTTAANNSISFGGTVVTASGFTGTGNEKLQVVVPRNLTLGDINLTVTTNSQTSAPFAVNVPVIGVGMNGGFY